MYISFRITSGLNLVESLDGACTHCIRVAGMEAEGTYKSFLWPGGQKAQA